MFTLPIIAFFIIRYLAVSRGVINVDMYAGFGAVGVANVVIVGYVVMAFNEEDEDADGQEGGGDTGGSDDGGGGGAGGGGKEPTPAVGIWSYKKDAGKTD